jgi:hypothetical protein
MNIDSQSWTVLPLEDYALAVPGEPGDLGIEMMVQARANGRIMDHYKFVVAGSVMSVTILSNKVYTADMLPAAALSFQMRPAQIRFRQNMVTSDWIDINDRIRSRDCLVSGQEDEEDEDRNAEFIELLDGLEDKEGAAASIRWALSARADGMFDLELQSLPASATVLNSKPILAGYVVLIKKFLIMYLNVSQFFLLPTK